MLHSTPHHLIIYALVKELLHALGGGERKESVAKAGRVVISDDDGL